MGIRDSIVRLLGGTMPSGATDENSANDAVAAEPTPPAEPVPPPPPSLEQLRDEWAAKFDVFPDIHPDDHMFNFLCKIMPGEKALQAYFEDGRNSAERFAGLAGQYQAKNVLEFASGYARVTRHMRNVAPDIRLTASDIHPEGNKFTTEQTGFPSIPSVFVPEEYSTGMLFDMAFALSLFSHLPKDLWTRWLATLVGSVKVGGAVAFTTHGRITVNAQKIEFGEEGFMFLDMTDQVDIDTKMYGSSYVTPTWVLKQIASIGRAALVQFNEGYWWGHQDLYVVRRI
jgi:hypothetical protein